MQGVFLGAALTHWHDVNTVGKRPRTQEYYAEVVGLVRQYWGGCDVPVDSISEQEVAAFVLKIAHYSASRFNTIVAVVKATIPAAKKLKRRRVMLKDRALLSQLEFSRLLVELDRRPQSHAGLVVRFLAHTGLRINEARQLRWSDVQDDFILAPGSVTKNGRPRIIPFINGIRQVLEELRGVTGNEEKILPQAECKRSLQTACALAELPRLSHHDFRHLYATRCIQSGVDLPTVARWLGHRDGGALLAQTYYHLADEHSRLMATRVKI